ncbi:hypothetical protein CEXT_259521 [Caerostris extrusa]|uniref:Uncharacterized protein n=1 Tax=Caerostris extrusa TaxID=172846 RepID=A0AAV4WGC9_CAEEX|nr:hypothetical protein CEXT_259521 [Caerostris extrusa]
MVKDRDNLSKKKKKTMKISAGHNTKARRNKTVVKIALFVKRDWRRSNTCALHLLVKAAAAGRRRRQHPLREGWSCAKTNWQKGRCSFETHIY